MALALGTAAVSAACVAPAPIEGALCDSASGCPESFACLKGQCRHLDGKIVVGCTSDEQCAPGACLEEFGYCVQCDLDAQCPGSSCLEDVFVCGCEAGEDCETGRCSSETMSCLSCFTDAQCASGLCDEQSGRCEEKVRRDAVPSGREGARPPSPAEP